jgi:hypothetical protein
VHFDDVRDYGQYAEHVCRAETTTSPAQAHLFGPRNPGDEATALSSELLVGPVVRDVLERRPGTAVGVDSPGDRTSANQN